MLSSLSDSDLLKRFAALVAAERRMTAALLAHIGEIDARHLYLQQGFESMRDYCMATLAISEQAAFKRIQVARLARTFPILLTAIAGGRLHMASVRMLSAHLTTENVGALIDSAAGKTKAQVEVLIAQRFPQAEPLRLDDGVIPQIALPPVESTSNENPLAPGRPDFYKVPLVRTKIKPIAPERFTLQVSISGAINDKLRRAQELLSHALPSGNVEQVLERALDSLIDRLEKRKFGTSGARRKSGPTAARRTIPTYIKARVHKRDGARCVHLYPDGRRCETTARLEFDHIVPLAKGGKTTVENLRLLCRAHNQFEAERAFGREFMKGKRCKRGS